MAGAAELAAAQTAAVARGLGAAAQKAKRKLIPVPNHTRRAHMRIAQTRILKEAREKTHKTKTEKN